jgi:Ser/Thr protein kinase RdoA (MazF antagonist)
MAKMTNHAFPVLFSTPDPQALAERVLPHYLLQPPIRCELLRSGRNDHYLVYDGEGTSYLKIHALSQHFGSRHRERLEQEVAVMVYLDADGLPVPTPIQRTDGNYLCEIAAPEGTRHGYLLRSAPGRPLEDAKMNDDQVGAVARLIARVHTCLDAAPAEMTGVNWDLHWLVDVSLEQVAPVLEHRPADRAYVQELGTAIKARVRDLLPQQAPAYGLIHGDLHQGNLYQDPAGALTLIDWESYGYGWRAWEIAYFLTGKFGDWAWDPAVEQMRERRRDLFLQAYLSERTLAADELTSVRLFPVARYLLAMGRMVRLRAWGDGLRATQDARIDAWLAFLHRWIDHHHPPL